jgi:hypothetical protein
VADWFAQLNNKMDGDLKKIRMIGQYMIGDDDNNNDNNNNNGEMMLDE